MNGQWVTLARPLYTSLKLRRGMGRAIMTLARRVKSLQRLPVRMNDGRFLYLDLREMMCMPYFLTGEIPYEWGETQFVRSAIRPGDTVVDIGANVGWYSTLLSELVGPRGKVYAFEPSEKALSLLTASVRGYSHAHVVAAALSDHQGEAELHVPAEGARVSLRNMQDIGPVSKQKCRVMTLDSFLKQETLSSVTFVKCDAEGAELEILHGAVGTLSRERPPMWMMEINPITTPEFGYHPDRLVEFFQMFPNAGYRGFHIDSRTGELEALAFPLKSDNFFNAVFVPAWLDGRVKAFQ